MGRSGSHCFVSHIQCLVSAHAYNATVFTLHRTRLLSHHLLRKDRVNGPEGGLGVTGYGVTRTETISAHARVGCAHPQPACCVTQKSVTEEEGTGQMVVIRIQNCRYSCQLIRGEKSPAYETIVNRISSSREAFLSFFLRDVHSPPRTSVDLDAPILGGR